MKQRTLISAIGILTVYLFTAYPAEAETIKLNSGDEFQAKIVERSDKYIRVERNRITVTYYLDEIENIIEDPIASISTPPPIEQKSVKPSSNHAPVTTQNSVPQAEKIVTTDLPAETHFVDDEQLKTFLVNVDRIEAKIDSYLDEHSDAINGFIENGQSDAAMKLVLQETNLINEAVKLLHKIEAPVKAQKLQEIMINYYQSMLQTQAAILKFIVDGPLKTKAVETATDNMIRLEKDFKSELNHLKKEYGIQSMPINVIHQETSFSNEEVIEYQEKLKQIQGENDALIAETKSLINANKDLQMETRRLQAELKMIKENMIEILKAAIEHSSQEQKQEFRAYLQTL